MVRFRYIDLLSHNAYTTEYILSELESLGYAQRVANMLFEVDLDNIVSSKHRIQLYIKYSGFDEISGTPKVINVDFVMDRDKFGSVTKRKIVESYSDVKAHNQPLTVMTLNTILANKLGMLMETTRNEPRDVYDIWFLLSRMDQYDFDIENVMKYFKQKYGFLPSCDTLLSELENKSYIKNWEVRLSTQIARLPDVKSVLTEIKKNLKKIWL